MKRVEYFSGYLLRLIRILVMLTILLSTSCALWNNSPQGGFSYDPSVTKVENPHQDSNQHHPPAPSLPSTSHSATDLERSSLEQKEKKWTLGQIELTLTDVGNFIPEAIGIMQELESRRQKVATLKVNGHLAQRMEDFYRGCGKPACLEWMLFRWFARQEPLEELEDEEEWLAQLDQKIAELTKTKTNIQPQPLGSHQGAAPYLQIQLKMELKEASKEMMILHRQASSADLPARLEAKVILPKGYWKKTLIQRLQWGRARGLQLIGELKQIKK